ncbi:MAG: phosphoribosylglycinamide formyltransferase [Cyclobacteriaceae bacterium]|nr:MAG: phosphoribosylglycinamide formyltransferase [Cyclobacteriaceae bacterium]
MTQLNTSSYRLAIFASGSGTNAEEIFKFFKNHQQISVAGLLSNNADAYALVRAANHEVPTMVFNRKQFRETDEVVNWLKEKKITHVVLAGFLWLIPENLIRTYPGKIINIHPALLPKFGGKGMYGAKVHEAVKAAGETETGITMHEVNEQYDEGRILFKAICPVMPDDTPEAIAHKVHQLEYAWYPKVIENWVLESR